MHVMLMICIALDRGNYYENVFMFFSYVRARTAIHVFIHIYIYIQHTRIHAFIHGHTYTCIHTYVVHTYQRSKKSKDFVAAYTGLNSNNLYVK
jgi:hypothetical protein